MSDLFALCSTVAGLGLLLVVGLPVALWLAFASPVGRWLGLAPG